MDCKLCVIIFQLFAVAATTSVEACFYKHHIMHIYRQGDKWVDGCEYKCECVQANIGYYRCKELCNKWDLPLSCTLREPAPGKCCKTPICPPWISIEYPEGYKEE